MAIGTALSQKKDQVGDTLIWKPSNYRNLLLTTIEAFDLVGIQRVRHPHLRKYSYVSLLKSRIDFFLVAWNLTSLWHRIIKQFACLCHGKMIHLTDQGFGNLQMNSYLLTTDDVWKKVWPPLKLHVKSPSSKNFN